MKICNYCGGRGHTFDGKEYAGWKLINKKQICKKCFGKGMK